MFLASLAVYVLATTQALAYLEPPSGDQPYYLITVISLVEDHDLDVHNNFTTSASDDEFYPLPPYPPDFKGTILPYPLGPNEESGPKENRPPDEWYSRHGPGLPLLLVPGWLIGQAMAPLLSGLTTAGRGGWPGVVFELNLLGALLATEIFLLAWDVSRSRRIALAVWAALAFSTPQLSYSLVVFPELPAALLVIYAFRRLSRGWAANRARQLGLIGLAIAYLPWLQVRFLPIAGALLLLALYAHWQAARSASAAQGAADAPTAVTRSDVARLLLVAGPLVLSGGLLAGYYVWLSGSPLPNVQDFKGFFVPPLADGTAGPRSGLAALLLAVVGLFFDQQFGLLPHAPVFGLVPLGAYALWRVPTRRPMLGWLALLILPYLLLVANYRGWWGEWSPPARYPMIFTPLLAAPLAQSLLALRGSRLYGPLFSGLAALGLAIMAVLLVSFWDRPLGPPPAFFNVETGQATLLLWLERRFGVDLTPFVPALTPWFTDRAASLPWALLATYLGALAALTAGGIAWLSAARRRPEPGPSAGRPDAMLAHLGCIGLVALALLGQAVWGPAGPGPPAALSKTVGEVLRTRTGHMTLVTNTTDRVITVAVEISYGANGVEVAKENGTASDVPPGQHRVAILVPSGPLPAGGVVEISGGSATIVDPDGARRAETAARLQLGQPRVTSRFGLELAVTNADRVAHSFSLQAMLFRDGRLSGVAIGAVDDLAPGQSRLAELRSTGRLPRYDRIEVAVGRLLK